jgi:hypothetical protein
LSGKEWSKNNLKIKYLSVSASVFSPFAALDETIAFNGHQFSRRGKITEW